MKGKIQRFTFGCAQSSEIIERTIQQLGADAAAAVVGMNAKCSDSGAALILRQNHGRLQIGLEENPPNDVLAIFRN